MLHAQGAKEGLVNKRVSCRGIQKSKGLSVSLWLGVAGRSMQHGQTPQNRYLPSPSDDFKKLLMALSDKEAVAQSEVDAFMENGHVSTQATTSEARRA